MEFYSILCHLANEMVLGKENRANHYLVAPDFFPLQSQPLMINRNQLLQLGALRILVQMDFIIYNRIF